MNSLRWGIRMLIIQLFFIVLVWLGSYFSRLDILFSLFYLYMVWGAGRVISRESTRSPLRKMLMIGVISQLPGIVIAALNVFYYLGTDWIAADFIYALQLWHTPFVPLLSFWTFPVYHSFNFYFAALFFMSPLYIVILMMPYIIEVISQRRHNKYTIAIGRDDRRRLSR